MITLVFVCAGNKCRSPAAQTVFAKMAKDAKRSVDFTVKSAGTYAKGAGQPADWRMTKAAALRGYTISGLARRIDSTDIYNADLIVTMDAKNTAYVTDMLPKNSVFKIAGVEPLCSVDVPDPYTGDEKTFNSVLDQIEKGCAELLQRI